MIKINKKEKDKLRNILYKRDGKKCYYCGIEEEDFIPRNTVKGQVLKYNKV